MNIDNNRVPFTQYLRPFGERKLVWIAFDEPEVITKAQMIIDNSYRFECEELRTGVCSFTILDEIEEHDVAIALCYNGPAVPDTVKKLIMEFDRVERDNDDI